MKIFETIITDSFEVRGDEWGEIDVNFESKYRISLSNWVIGILVLVLILSNSENIISLLQKYVLRDRMGRSTVSRESINSNQITQNNAEDRTILNEHKILERNEGVMIHQRDTCSPPMQLNKSNEFSVAFKYLCTCIPGNRIEARKPIKSFQSMYGNH